MPVESQGTLEEKTVLITGASSGFGLAAARAFLDGGWRVLAAVRGGMKRRELFEELWSFYPNKLELLELDLTDANSIDTLLSRVEKESIQALVNNAGYGLFGAAEDISDESIRRQMEVNFFGTFRLTQGLLPKLRVKKGVILTVSSVVGRHALPLTSAYCASKFAVEGWMESMAMELKPFGIDCYLLEPGTFPTQFGKGIDWATPKLGSPYAPIYVGYENLRIKTFETAKSRSVSAVGMKIRKLVESRPKSLRHPVGPDAHATMLVARIIPPNLFHKLSTKLLNYLQRRDLKVH